MVEKSRIKDVAKAVKRLFKPYKGNVTRINHKDQYYRQYFFPKGICDTIAFLAYLDRTTNQQAALKLMESAIALKIRSLLRQHSDSMENIPLNQRPPESRRFIKGLRREARKKGMDISKFI